MRKSLLFKRICQTSLLVLFLVVALVPALLPKHDAAVDLNTSLDTNGILANKLKGIEVIAPDTLVEQPLSDTELLDFMGLTAACKGSGSGGSGSTYNCNDKNGKAIGVAGKDCGKCKPKEAPAGGGSSCEGCCDSEFNTNGSKAACKQTSCNI